MANNMGPKTSTKPIQKILPCPNPSYKPATRQNLLLDQIQDSRLGKIPHHPHLSGWPGVSTMFSIKRAIKGNATTGLPPPLPPPMPNKISPKPGLSKGSGSATAQKAKSPYIRKQVRFTPNIIISAKPPAHPSYPRPINPDISKPITSPNYKPRKM